MKRASNKLFFSLLCSLFFFSACKVNKPKTVLSESTMENVIYDYHIAKAMGDDVNYSENYKRAIYIDAVFDKYGIDEAQFDSSLVWYTRNTDILSKVYERVADRLKSKQSQINQLVAIRDKKPLTSQPGDSIDVWAWKRLLNLSRLPLNNKYAFVLPTDTNFKQRDELVWSANFYFAKSNDTVAVDSVLQPIMAMQIIYNNDSIVSKLLSVASNGTQTITLMSDTLGDIREVKGFIYYPHADINNTLLIDKISLMRYHHPDTTTVATDSIAADELKIATDTLETDTLLKVEAKEEVAKDTVAKRLSPAEMNRQRQNAPKVVKKLNTSEPINAVGEERIKRVTE